MASSDQLKPATTITSARSRIYSKAAREVGPGRQAKLLTSIERAPRVTNKALQIHGGYGYTKEYLFQPTKEIDESGEFPRSFHDQASELSLAGVRDSQPHVMSTPSSVASKGHFPCHLGEKWFITGADIGEFRQPHKGSFVQTEINLSSSTGGSSTG